MPLKPRQPGQTSGVFAAETKPKYITNYIGSKQKLIEWIWKNTPDDASTVLDASSGSGGKFAKELLFIWSAGKQESAEGHANQPQVPTAVASGFGGQGLAPGALVMVPFMGGPVFMPMAVAQSQVPSGPAPDPRAMTPVHMRPGHEHDDSAR